MSVNKWIGIGNLTKEPELKYTPQGTAVCTFSVACNERFKDSDGNKKVEFLNIVAWQKLAEICGKYLHKGKQVYIEGRIQTRSYDDRDGNKRYITEIVADQMQMLGSKGDSNGQQGGYAGGQQPQGPREAQYQQAQCGGGTSEPAFYIDEQIPF